MKRSEREKFHLVDFDYILPRFPIRKAELDRFKFGKKCYFEIANLFTGCEPLCLDVGSGHKPFPKANILCDPFIKPNPDRRMERLRTESKPFIQCDGCFLPFKNKVFDFVTCYYVLEHIINPAHLLIELKRVSKHGYIQCPSWLNEFIYGAEVHRWIIMKKNNKLYAKYNDNEKMFKIRLGFIFNKLYRLYKWRILHAIFDETFHIFSINYKF